MKNIFMFLQPYKVPIIIAYTLTFIELIAELLLPFFLGKMINNGIVEQDLKTIIMWGIIMVALTFISFGAGIVNSFYASHVSLGYAYDVREKLFLQIQSFSFSNLSSYPTASLVTRFTNDVRQIQNTIFMALRVMIKAPFMVIGGVLMAFLINAKLALIFIVTVPLLIVFLAWVLKKAGHMFTRVQKKVDYVNRVMQENLSGMRLIKAFYRHKYEKGRFTRANEELAVTTKSAFRFVEASMPILLFIMNISLIVIIWLGSLQTNAGLATPGDIVAIVNYALRISMAISMFTFITLAFSRAKASADRIDSIINVQPKDDYISKKRLNKTYPKIVKGKISFNTVSFTYPKREGKVLDKVSFTVEPNEKLAIIGATGAGKTSLFQLIPRLFEVQEGMIYIDDRPITDYEPRDLRSSIGYVTQTPLLFSGTIKENIMWGNEKATVSEMIHATKTAQIHEPIMQFPEQYDTPIGQQGVRLSGGQKQRISIARALIRKPKILLLDDSTSSLDQATESLFLKSIEQIDCTTLIIAQKISTARHCDRIMLMDEGKIIAIGTHEYLVKHAKLYKDIFASQGGKELIYVD
ncbi:ABC transporter ATP-binding protein [Virgibacillus sp. W0430]|uniref:ABC transporter ATP-binding protein n=1 Tax=Virgibacillus sp. W0430 TaxID=3391580 RepID=UPI003F46E18F